LDGVFAGSWIGHNFRIWVGEKLTNAGWDYLGRTRRVLVTGEGGLSPDARARAWEGIYRAEGSDWFWWFSEQHSSSHDMQFDRLFRGHLRGVFEELGVEVPAFVLEPIIAAAKPPYTEPYALLDVRVDGRRSDYFEWLCAGHYDPSFDQGAMARARGSEVKELYFGFDLTNFYLRVDFVKNMESLTDAGLAVSFFEPRSVELEARSFASNALSIKGGREEVGVMAADKFVEISVPLAELGIGKGQTARFQVELRLLGGVVERLPVSGPIRFTSPTDEYELVQWQV
jgi:hypothetical protein